MKKAKGTDQPCRMQENKIPLTKLNDMPKAPTFLGRNGKKIFKNVTEYLDSVEMLNINNFPLIVAYSNELGKYYEYEGEAKKNRLLERMDGQGNIIKTPNPLNKMANEALNNAMRMAAEFGITPQAQTKILALISNIQEANDEFFD